MLQQYVKTYENRVKDRYNLFVQMQEPKLD